MSDSLKNRLALLLAFVLHVAGLYACFVVACLLFALLPWWGFSDLHTAGGFMVLAILEWGHWYSRAIHGQRQVTRLLIKLTEAYTERNLLRAMVKTNGRVHR